MFLEIQGRVDLANSILDSCEHHQILLFELNILADHVHLLIDAEAEQDLNNKVRIIKGRSSFQCRHSPWRTKDAPLWAQKFNRRPLRTSKDTDAAMKYVALNHFKHAGDWGELFANENEKELRPFILGRLAELKASVCSK